MGYTTTFKGSIKIDPPLNTEEIAFLKKFNETRRMHRSKGPYYVDNTGFAGQDEASDVINYNAPPNGQPGLWCQWRPSDDGQCIEWDGNEKFYQSAEWMKYIIEHFLRPNAIASPSLPFLSGHVCSGTIYAQGEDSADRWKLVVDNNTVKIAQARSLSYETPHPL